MNSVEILDKKQQLKQRAKEICEGCKMEIRNLSNSENEELANIKKELLDLNEEERKLNETFKITENNNIKEDKKIMEKRFSLIKAIRNIADNKPLDNVSEAVVNAGSKELRDAGLNYVGQIQIPAEERAVLTVATEGEDTVATDLMNVLEPLRAKNVMAAAGAKFLTNLVGNVRYPIMSTINTYWEGETGPANENSTTSIPTFSHVDLAPKRLTCIVPISKQFLLQDSVGAEQAIRSEIINAINGKLESTILGNASGTTTQPAGIFYAAEAPAVTSGFSGLTNLEASLETNNFYGEKKYILSPSAKAAFRNMPKSSKTTQLVMEGNEIDGTPALTTSNVTANYFAYGDFSQYIIAQWGAIDITVDNVTLAGQGCVRLIVNAYFDAKPLRDGAIKIGRVA